MKGVENGMYSIHYQAITMHTMDIKIRINVSLSINKIKNAFDEVWTQFIL